MTGRGSRHITRRERESWTIVFDGVDCRLCDALGIQHLAYLLRHPCEEVSSLFLELQVANQDVPTGAGPHARVGCHDARERARVNVTRAIDGALRLIADRHRTLGEHLRATVRTGTFCTYVPDPPLSVSWIE